MAAPFALPPLDLPLPAYVRRAESGLIVPRQAVLPGLIMPPGMMARGGDPFWDNVVMLMHFDGANGSTTFIDEKGTTINVVGHAQISTAQSKFGGASGYFDGTGDYLTATRSAGLGSGDFTVEFFFWTTDAAKLQCVLDLRGSSDPYIAITSGTIQVSMSGVDPAISGPILQDTWHHYALTRSGSTCRQFIDGTQVGSYTTTANFTGTDTTIGTYVDRRNGDYARHFGGYLDELRITAGVARYTSNFTPPSKQFPDR